MIGQRQHAGQLPLSLPVLFITIISSILLEMASGQPNYYFKSAPSGRVLPRIGRRSDGDFPRGGGGSEASVGTVAIPFSRPIDSPTGGGGIVDTWQSNPLLASTSVTLGDLFGGRSLLAPGAAATALSNQLDKALLWRRLFGDGGSSNYEEALLENMYRSKS